MNSTTKPTGIFPVTFFSYSRSTTVTDLRNPYLVQRILSREPNSPTPFGNMVGYYKLASANNIKLNEAERGALRKIIPCDYMGSAEFEFGAIFKALEEMSRIELVEASFTVTGKPDTYCYVDPAAYNKLVTQERSATVYVLCIKEHVESLKKYFDMMSKDRYAFQHKENPEIRSGLFGNVKHPEYKGTRRPNKNKLIEHESTSKVTGWLELDMHWFATTDKTQLEDLKIMLGK